MIVRIWRGRTHGSQGEEYFSYIKKTGVKDYTSTEGNRGVYVLRQMQDGIAEFWLITLWDSIEAIKKFSGPEVKKAFYYPDDSKFLLELEPHVEHFEVLLASIDESSYNKDSLPKLMKHMKGIRI